jgi:hypothetical protein
MRGADWLAIRYDQEACNVTGMRGLDNACTPRQSRTLDPASRMPLTVESLAGEARHKANFNTKEQWRQFLVKPSFCSLDLANL